MTKVSLFLDVFPPPFIGGAEKSSIQILQILEESGFEVSVHALHSERKTDYRKVKVHKIINLYNPFKSYVVPKIARYFWHILNLLNIFEISRSIFLLKEDRPELVITQNVDTWGFAPLIASRLLKVPTIHFVRDFGAICPTRTMWSQNRNCNIACKKCQFRLQASRMLLKPDVVIFNSHFTKDQYLKQKLFSLSRNVVLYPLIDTQDVLSLTMDKRTAPREWTLGFIGRVSQEKGVEDFLWACTQVNAIAIVAGSGDDQYINLLKEKFPRVKFLGQLGISEFLKQVSVVVVPSLWNEPFGRIVVESCIGKVPLVIAKRGGLIESSTVFNHENYVCLYEDREELMVTLSKLKNASFNEHSEFDVKGSYENFRFMEEAKFKEIVHEIIP